MTYLLRLTTFTSAMLGLVWVAPIILAYLGVRKQLSTAAFSKRALIYLLGFMLVGAWTVFILWALSRMK